jgi:hypothetical protein
VIIAEGRFYETRFREEIKKWKFKGPQKYLCEA